jgi:hypothetical protein
MSNNTISVNGGAMPKVNPASIMTRAWATFRQTYCYPRIKFSNASSIIGHLPARASRPRAPKFPNCPDKKKPANYRVNAGAPAGCTTPPQPPEIPSIFKER